MDVSDGAPSTRERLLVAAMSSFAARGYEATSLDDIAAVTGVRKQTLLYYHPSKEALLGAVIQRSIAELSARIGPAAKRGRSAVVDELFRVGADRPELLDLIREALRLGPPASMMLSSEAEPLIAELAEGLPRNVVLGAVAIVVGMATEVEVLRSLGIAPSLGELRRRRRILLAFLDAHARALEPQ